MYAQVEQRMTVVLRGLALTLAIQLLGAAENRPMKSRPKTERGRSER
jgi:hypothetical protein